MEQILGELNKAKGVEGSIVTGRDGLVITAQLSRESDKDVVSALTSSVFGVSQESVGELDQGELKFIIIEASKGKTLMVDIGDAILVVLTEPQVNLGLLRMEIKKAAEKIKEVL